MQRKGWRFGAIALLALLVRAFVPAGFMLAEADTGSGRYLTLELCDSHGGVPKVVDLETGKIMDAPVKGQGSDEQPPCVFCASVVTMASPEPIVELIKFVAEHGVDFVEIRDLRPGRGIAAPPPPSTGPPSRV
jgi:hypothetical protein